MDIVGVVVEYNPFHKGHKYHIDKIKEKFPDSIIIAAMSGNFTQRGEISIVNKWDKTRIALLEGIDIVAEIPFVFATESADKFAKCSIQMLSSLGCSHLVFGSECNDTSKLFTLALAQVNNPLFEEQVKKHMHEGLNYPTSISRALYEITKVKIDSPNDILGIAYIKEIIKQNSDINPSTIKRTNDYHNTTSNEEIISASNIREKLLSNIDVKRFVPEKTYALLPNDISFVNDYFDYLKFKIISEGLEISKYQTVDEGIEYKILKVIYEVNSIDELIGKLKTKRYTYNKLKRMFIHILCSFTKDEANENNDIKYIRLLGFNERGQKHLNKIKKSLKVPLLTKFDPDLLSVELRVSSIYGMIRKDKLSSGDEYKRKPLK